MSKTSDSYTQSELATLRSIARGAPISRNRRSRVSSILRDAELCLTKHKVHKSTTSTIIRALVKTAIKAERPICAWTTKDWETALDTAGKGRIWIGVIAWKLYGVNLSQSMRAKYQSTYYSVPFATAIFGNAVARHVDLITTQLISIGYSQTGLFNHRIDCTIADLMLMSESAKLSDLRLEHFLSLRTHGHNPPRPKWGRAIAIALRSLNIINYDLPRFARRGAYLGRETVDRTWLEWLEKWEAITPVTPNVRKVRLSTMLGVGRWLRQNHPDVNTPDWSPTLAAQLNRALHDWRVGEYMTEIPRNVTQERKGDRLAPKTIWSRLADVRAFFREIEEYGLISLRFQPKRIFQASREIRSQLGPDPRTIEPAIWSKLVWAGLNLRQEQMPTRRIPFELYKAIAIVWLFSGLRSDEIRRLEMGCCRKDDAIDIDLVTTAPERPDIAILTVPVNKMKGSFSKPVDGVVFRAIAAWENIRPKQSSMRDRRTGRQTNYLFMYRNSMISPTYINDAIIPVLCEIAGVPRGDKRGRYTAHRGRATLATALRRGKTPMPLPALAQWLGHADMSSVGHYEKTSLQDLTENFVATGHLNRSLRAIEVLINRDVIRVGSENSMEPYKLYNLGHGYCANEFWSQCSHRMACVKCASYVPNDDGKLLLAKNRGPLVRMLEEVELSDEEETELTSDVNAITKTLKAI